MDQSWKLGRWVAFVVIFFFSRSLRLSWCLNDEGFALLRFRDRVISDPFGALSSWKDEEGVCDPCSWNGVECSDGKVVALNLKDLCLDGTLAPELANLVQIKSIILRNNSFTGVIPKGIQELKELEVLDLGYNNFSGPLPAELGSNLSLIILLLDNNENLGNLPPEIYGLQMFSESQVDEDQLSNIAKGCGSAQNGNMIHKRRMQDTATAPKERIRNRGRSPSRSSSSSPASLEDPSPSPSPSPSSSPSPSPSPSASTSPPPSESPPSNSTEVPSPAGSTRTTSAERSTSKSHIAAIVGGIGGGVILISIIGIYLCQSNKVATVKPWATGLSGQLQKAFVTGVPKLKRSEIQSACEDFSNVIGSSPIGTVYKGTLSNGVEIAVASVAATSAKDWSRNLEAQYRKKIDTLSKVNHKNFVNLLGYCAEEEPFTRMIVFEYAPNGTLFEHLHIKEAEHLDWGMRLRIAMGMAYCLEHMHQLNPPIPHNNLNSSAVSLTEDYAAKISEFSFWNEIVAAEIESAGLKNIHAPSVGPESNVYSLGVVLFEMFTCRLPYSVDNTALDDWAADFLSGEQPLREIVDPTLTSVPEDQLELIGEVIKSCVQPDPRRRPAMKEVSARLRAITGISHEGAHPRLSPLWWAELEITSADAS